MAKSNFIQVFEHNQLSYQEGRTGYNDLFSETHFEALDWRLTFPNHQ